MRWLLGYSGDGGSATNAEITDPDSIAISPGGKVYFAEGGDARVRAIGLWTKPVITWPVPSPISYGTALSSTQLNATSTAPGVFTYTPASGTTPAAGTAALSVIFTPTDSSNYQSVAAWVPLTVTGGSPPSIVTVAGSGTQGYSADGAAATSAELSSPFGIAFDSSGNLYIADRYNSRVRKVNVSTGVITTVAGNGGTYVSGLGGPATSASIGAEGLAVDSAGNLYLGGTSYLFKVTASTGIVTAIAGNGTEGYTGDGGPATSAEIGRLEGVALDSSGNVYFSDLYNHVVRKVTVATGIISTIAGTGTAGFSGDGGAATSAQLLGPDGVAVDASGNVYIADQYNDRIRKVTAATGIITTVAGSDNYQLYGCSYIGDGGPATEANICWAEGIALDSSGNLYIADKLGNRIREVNASTGIITTIAGNGTLGFSGDGGAAANAELANPAGIAISPAGHLYFSDQGNNRIRALTGNLQIPTITWATPASISYGTALSATQLDATASVAGTFVYSPAAGTLEKPGTNTLSVTFTPTDVLDYASATKTVSLTVTGTVPVISSISPSSAKHGATVTITGTAFGTSGTVTFNGVAATVTSWSATTIVATVPGTATNGNVIVTPTGSGPSSGTPFTVTGIYDSGTVSLTIDGVTATASYGQGSTPCTVAASLVSAFNAISGASVTLSSGTCTATTAPILVTSKTDGASTDYLYSVSSTYDSAVFSQASFTAAETSGTLSGGSDGTSNSAPVYQYSITNPSSQTGYAPNGNVLNFSDSVTGIWAFSYDTLNRLLTGFLASSTNPYPYYCWAYDAFGNRTLQSNGASPLQSGDSCVSTNGVNNAITTVGSNNQVTQTNVNGVTWTPAYDASGNLLSDGANQYLYDGEGRVCAVKPSNPAGGGAVMTQYIYDAEGNRVGKGTISTFSCNTASNGFSLTESYILGQSGEQVTELDGSGNFKHTNVYANGSLIATYDANGTTADPTPIHFQLSDWLGSRRVQTSYNGTVEYTFQNLPFGDTLVKQPNSECSTSDQCFATDATEHHFTGKERDTESGLDYFGARMYGSSMGRWMSPDPLNLTDDRLLNPQTLNKYGYAADNPLKYVDDDGKDITVFYEKSSPLDPTSFGHIMFVAENQQTGDAAAMSFGPVHDSEYGLTPLGAPVNSTNSFIAPGHTFSADDLRQNFASLTIQTSPEEAQKVIEFIRNLSTSSNPYMLFKNNCTTTCVQALKILGLLPSNNKIITPKSLWNNLFPKYSGVKNTNFFGQQKAPTNGVNYGYQPGYDPFQLMDLLNKQCTDSWDSNSNTLTSTCN